jgi:hypothetical protein
MTNSLNYYRYDNNTVFTSYSPTDFSIFSTSADDVGTISLIQNINNSSLLYSNYGFTNNQYIALKISGFFTPNITGLWGFQLGNSLPNDDLSYLWIGDSAYNPSPNNALGMTYWYSNLVTVYIDLIAGQSYPILIYWGQSTGPCGISNGIIPPGGNLTFDGSNYYSNENGLTYYSYNNNNVFTNYSPTDFSIFDTPYDGTGIISTIENSYNATKLLHQYGFNSTNYIALKIKGYFNPDISGTWGFQLGNIFNPNDDLSYLWIGDSVFNPTTNNALGMTFWYSNMVIVNIDLIAGQKYPILIYWGQSYGGYGISNGIIPPGGNLTFDGSKYYTFFPDYASCSYPMSPTELVCYQNNNPDLKDLNPTQLQPNWSTTGCKEDRNNQCPSYQINSGLYNYIGCYNDMCFNGGNGQRALPNYRGLVNSIDNCEAIADSNNESLFGVQNAAGNGGTPQCFTGNDLIRAQQYGLNVNRNQCAALGGFCNNQLYQRVKPFPPPIPALPILTTSNFANSIETFENRINYNEYYTFIILFLVIFVIIIFKYLYF